MVGTDPGGTKGERRFAGSLPKSLVAVSFVFLWVACWN